jgi:squalene-associated FAD-dependent desaturase
MAERAPTVAIVGGGLAGLSAACALAGSGFRVTVFERRPYLGGRASSYEHPGTGEVVDNCQHVLFGSCTNLLAFYKTIGIENKIRWFDRMTFIEPGGRQSVLEPTFLPAPLHLTPSFLGFKFLNATDKLSLARGLRSLMFRQPKDDGTSFQDWLIHHRQTPAAIERFWKPILVSALSEDMDRISVPYAAQVVRESMKSPAARRMGIPNVPLTELYNAARDYISAHNGLIRLRDSVQSFLPTPHRVLIKLQNSEEEFDYGVLAVPFDSLAKLLPYSTEPTAPSNPSEDLREKLTHFETSPITGVHLWFDRQITDLPHAVLLDRTIQWMFHKSQLLDRENSNSLPPQNTVRTPAPQGQNAAPGASPGFDSKATESQRDGRNPVENPSYVELVISSSKSLREKSRQEIIDLALRELREFFPAAREANLVKATVIKEVNATFSPTPGIDRYRPPSETPWPRIFLAGDWTATGWPATMEGAVRSGYQAAERITKNQGAGKRFLVPDLSPTGLMRVLS